MQRCEECGRVVAGVGGDDTADVVIVIATLGPDRVGCYVFLFLHRCC